MNISKTSNNQPEVSREFKQTQSGGERTHSTLKLQFLHGLFL